MLKLLEIIKKNIIQFKFIYAGLALILILFVINKLFWQPVLEREEKTVEAQQDNEELMRQREEQRFKIDENGVVFDPTGRIEEIENTQTKPQPTDEDTVERSESEDKVYNSDEITEFEEKIEDRISYLYNRLIKQKEIQEEEGIEKKEVSEVKKDLFIPFYKKEKNTDEQEEEIKYKPDYNLNLIEYRGFYQRGGVKTAIIRYDGEMLYLSSGDFLKNTVLSLSKVESSHIVFIDEKNQEEKIIYK
ncbi:MAG: hypothetical protein ACQESP_01130 [Candidatus Muiribacteriota bacterium]